jgi:phage shock protein PspC (stress-responsive transcriptional regulator)/FtsH-binding integral membrane protein
VTREELKQLGRIRRTVGPDRKVAGVAGGLARHLDIDPVILRVGFVVLVFFGGAGLIAYGACWLLIPEDYSLRRPLGLDDRNRGIALIGAGVIAGIIMLSGTLGNDFFPWPVAIIGVIVFLVLGLVDRDKPRPSAPPVPHVPDPVTGAFAPATPGTYVVPPAPPAYRPPPRNPRRRGPILFWFTLLLSVVGIGVLGIVDLAGVSVADAAYPAVVVGACGVMLLVGAFYGRAGGLILVGLLSSLVLVGATASQKIDGADITRHPLTAAEVPADLDTSAGEIVLDLTDVSDLAAMDGKHIKLDVSAGRIEVLVPSGLSVEVIADVNGPGHIQLFGDERGGIGIADRAHHDAGAGTPEIVIDADVSVGEIQVHEGAF